MTKLCVRNFSISLDGYAAAPNQSLEHPFGEPDPPLHEWMLATRFGRQIMGEDGGTEGLDNVLAVRLFDEHRRQHHGAEHVRPDPWRVGER